MTIQVDKLIDFGVGGIIYDFDKIEKVLKLVKITKDKLINKDLPIDFINTSLFSVADYIAIIQVNRQFTKGQLALVTYKVDIEKHFDHFADTLSPKTIQAFFDIQQRIKSKDDSYFNQIELVI